MVLIGAVLPVAMKGLSLALEASNDARRRLEATTLAENKLAEMAASAVFQSQTASGAGSGGLGTGSGEFVAGRNVYYWEADAAAVDVDLTEMHVRVYWVSRDATRSVGLSTLVYASGATTTGTGTSAVPSAAGGGGAP